ncbi:MAG: hypothetical protein H8D67_21315 [Deltaproteobacteria bacterium]|nr:hypothetical protein [Deltaproteobacteria bacterium]MBL7202821.1 hypothetical protein [Desulfobacteraceae bacterium]
MDKQEKAHRLKSGSTEWLQEIFYERWQVIRRDPEYLEFCNDYASAFDKNGIMKLWEGLEPRVEEIRKLFGLETICHPSLNLSKEALLDYPLFNEPLAVSYEWTEEQPGHYSPIVDEHFIRLRIDIDKKTGQILSEVQEFIEDARSIAGAKPNTSRLRPDEEIFKVWDLSEDLKKTKDKKTKDKKTKNKDELTLIQKIIKQLWPEEYDRECKEGSPMKLEAEKKKKYQELAKKYRSQGVEEWNEKAFNEVYGLDSSGCIKLYMRVKDKLEKMRKLQRRVRTF